MSAPPKHYRVYGYDGALNILQGEWIKAESDEEAISAASRMNYGSRCEIWDGKRLVAKLDSKSAIANQDGRGPAAKPDGELRAD